MSQGGGGCGAVGAVSQGFLDDEASGIIVRAFGIVIIIYIYSIYTLSFM